GVIVRTAAAGASAKELESDLEFLVRLWKRVQIQSRSGLAPEVVYTEIDLALRMARDVFGPEFKRLVIDDPKLYDKVLSFLKKTSPDLIRHVYQHKDRVPLFEAHGVLPQAEKALVRTVPLQSGGHLTVDKTEALTAIDVNTGSYVGRRNLEETVVKTNLEAADEAVRQLRLRDIGGIIIIDFIDMEDAANRALVQRRLASALERDRTKTRMGEMTRFGLVEITRKNVTDGLYGVLTERCPTCGGEGRVLSDATRRISAERRMREVLTTGRSSAYVFGLHPETYALVTAPGTNAVAILRAETGKDVTILADPDCGPTDVKVIVEGHSGAGSGDEQPTRRGPWPRRRE
ncbi:MAG TPA: ribonuclease E/G, partial [Coriobacteriia bacterium]|nr:ribonuclease E/G [Coriobacteriia bacterium]